MAKIGVKTIIEPFFSHDIASRQDGAIIELMMDLGWEGYGLFWGVVEYMHRNTFKLGEEKKIAYNFRCEIEKIHSIMNNYGLFRKENDCYISERILRNIAYTEAKSEQNQEAANVRWLLSSFNKEYEIVFGEAPILSSEEIKKLVGYQKAIKDLKEKLPDIIFTLKNIKFDNDINFKPCANWLLKNNHLLRILNGEFGKLKHKKTEKEIKEEKKLKKMEMEQVDDFAIEISSICNKVDAIDFILEHHKHEDFSFLSLVLNDLAKKFDITKKELKEQRKNGKA